MSKRKFPSSACVHDGPFHADDVMAVALVTIINPNMKIIRTRDEVELQKAEMRIDVGGKYNPTTFDFDHHLEDNEIKRYPNFLWSREERIGPKLSGIGLVWEHYGMQAIRMFLEKEHKLHLTMSQMTTIFENVKRNLIIPIDIEDNGEQREYFGSNVSPFRPLTINAIIQSLVPQIRDENLNDSEEAIDNAFHYAVSVAQKVLKGNILRQYYSVHDVEILKALLLKHDKSPIFVLPKICSWQYALIALERLREPNLTEIIRSIDFVIYPVPSATKGKYNWMVQPTKAWNKEKQMYDMKFPLAENLRGKKINELIEISRIPTLTFVHPSGFIGGAVEQEDAIKLAEYTINYIKEIEYGRTSNN